MDAAILHRLRLYQRSSDQVVEVPAIHSSKPNHKSVTAVNHTLTTYNQYLDMSKLGVGGGDDD